MGARALKVAARIAQMKRIQDITRRNGPGTIHYVTLQEINTMAVEIQYLLAALSAKSDGSVGKSEK